jgi:hypothetical protein
MLAATLLTPETQALIAETEAEPKELRSANIPLTVTRAFDLTGQVIPRRFICSTELFGRTITAAAGTKMAAHKSLQQQIRMLGYEPMWNAVRDFTVLEDSPDDEPEDVPATVEPVYESTTPTAEPEQPGEHEDQQYHLVVQIPTLDKSGWLTPLSDPLAYKQVYLAAWKLATGFSVYSIADLTAEAWDVRASVAAVMMSGDAGESVGIPAKAVNPWALGTNGEREMCWVRVLRGTPDPTTKPFRAGNGEAREAYLTTLSGTPAFPEKYESAREWREKRAARRFIGTKGASTVAAKDAREARRAQAHVHGSAAKTAAFEAGYDEGIAEIHYKWVYCSTMRILGEIHSEFEHQLADAGIIEEQILETAEQMKG